MKHSLGLESTRATIHYERPWRITAAVVSFPITTPPSFSSASNYGLDDTARRLPSTMDEDEAEPETVEDEDALMGNDAGIKQRLVGG